MRLTALRIEGLTGLTGPLAVDDLKPGVNVIVGRNASGKSSLVRALAAVLYPDRHTGQVSARIDMQDAFGGPTTVRRLGAQVEWQVDGKVAERPNLPPPELLAAYVLRLEDLIALEPDSGTADAGALDEYMSRQLHRELTGGVDLRDLRDGIPTQKTAGRKEATALREAEAALARLKRDRDALRQRYERLAEDRQALARAQADAERLRFVGVAEELVGALVGLDECEAELAAMPPQLERLTGEETEEVSRLRESFEASLRAEEHLRAELAHAEETTEAVTLPADLSTAEAGRVKRRAEELCRLERDLERAEVEAAAARAAKDAAWRRMGGAPGSADQAIEPDVVDHVERLVQRQVVVLARLSGLRRRLAVLDGDPNTPAGAPEPGGSPATLAERLAALHRCRLDLARWSEAALAARRVPGWVWIVAVLLSGLSGALALAAPRAAAGSALAAPWPVVAASGATVMWLLLCLLLYRRSGTARARAAFQVLASSADDAGLPLPEALTLTEATMLIDETAARIAQLEGERAEAQDRAREREVLGSDLDDATAEWERIAEELTRLRSRHGFAPGPSVDDLGPASGPPDTTPDAGFAYWLNAALVHANESVGLAAAEAEVRDLEDRVSDVRAEVGGFLDRCARGAGSSAGASGTDILSACEEIVSALSGREAAAREAADLRRSLDRTLGDRASTERSLAALALKLSGRNAGVAPAPAGWTSAAIDDLALTARRLVDALPAWRGARQKRTDLKASSDFCRNRLADDPELLAAAESRDLAAIDALATAARSAKAEADRLTERINKVEAEVRIAEGNRTLQEASAKARQARDELEAHLDQALEIRAARFLLDVVEEEHESALKPAALERARAWFGRFTHGEFELVFERDDDEWRFGAVDNRTGAGGLRLRPSELSTGTRAQLFVAARLAFALEAEAKYAADGRPVEALPFFLDEALTTSDPERFSQVANAIFDVSQETGRQFIYLSAREEDAELWRDVAAERGASVTAVTLAGPVAGSPAT